MKKTLLIAAAALAASVISSQAQVYSQNIVGYVNKPLPNGYVNLANPLVGSNGNNSITNIIPVFSGVFDGSVLISWAGTHYNNLTIDSSVSTGIADANDVNAVTPPTYAPGVGFFIQNTTGTSNTLTFVGTVLAQGPAVGAGTVGVSTNTVSSSPSTGFYASQVPVGGGISSILQLPSNGSLDGSLINIPVISAGGSITGFQTTTIDSSVAGGFADANDVNPVAQPTIPVASAFFIQNTTGLPVKWIQSF